MTARLRDSSEIISVTVGSREHDVCASYLRSSQEDSRVKFVLIHGNPSSMDDWEPLSGFLLKHGNILAFDLPGFGRSPRASEEDVSLNTLSELTVSLARYFGWRSDLTIVGHSHGGGIAQTVAARYPNIVGQLVLLGSLGYPAHGAYRLLSLPGLGGLLEGMTRACRSSAGLHILEAVVRRSVASVFAPESPPEGFVAREVEEFVRRPDILRTMSDLARGCPSAQLRQQSRQIRSPVLFIHGKQDRLVKLRYVDSLYRCVKASVSRAQFERLDGAGHMFHITQADAVAGILRRWCRSDAG